MTVEGYVIRRILRRAVRYGWDKLDLKQPFMYKLVDGLAQRFHSVFPELSQQQEFVVNIIRAEEEGVFCAPLDRESSFLSL